jgi:hypothetical protein
MLGQAFGKAVAQGFSLAASGKSPRSGGFKKCLCLVNSQWTASRTADLIGVFCLKFFPAG